MSIALIASSALLTVQKDDLESRMMQSLESKNQLDNQASELGDNINDVEEKIDDCKDPKQKEILEGFLKSLQDQLHKIQRKEKRVDLEVQQEQYMYQGVQTELQSVQQQSDKDIQQEFKIFA
jgi:DNA repair exonuclease SbcCD ATPase subunit